MVFSILHPFKKSPKSILKQDDETVKDADNILAMAEKSEIVLAEKLIKVFDDIFKLLEKGEKDIQLIFELMEQDSSRNNNDFQDIVGDLTNELTLINHSKRDPLFSDIMELEKLCKLSLQAANSLEFVLKQHGFKDEEIKEIGALEEDEKRILSDLKDFIVAANKLFGLVKEILDIEQAGLDNDSKSKAKELRRRMNALSVSLLKCDSDIKDIAKILNDTGLFLQKAHKKGIMLDVAINNVLSLIYAGKIPDSKPSEDQIIRQKIRDVKDGAPAFDDKGNPLLRTNQSTKMLRNENNN